jgi:hypothetical protein
LFKLFLHNSLDEGVANVTVIYGATEYVLPVRVEIPHLNSAVLGKDGGAVQAIDRSMVMVAPGALKDNATVSIKQLSQDELTLAIPEQDYSFAGAFKLDVGDNPLDVPLQIAIPNTLGLAPGTEVFFMRQAQLPDSTGDWKPIWMMEESGVVGDDGMIRTSSPPWNGAYQSGTYTITVPKFEYRIVNFDVNAALLGATFMGIALVGAGIATSTGVSKGVNAFLFEWH